MTDGWPDNIDVDDGGVFPTGLLGWILAICTPTSIFTVCFLLGRVLFNS